MPISVLLTLDGLREQEGAFDGGLQGSGTLNVRAKMSDDLLLEVRLSFPGWVVDHSRQGKGDDTVECGHGRGGIEEDNRSVPVVDGQSQGRLGLVDHVMHSVQGNMRVAAMPPAQAYGVGRSMPSLQGPLRPGMHLACQGDAL